MIEIFNEIDKRFSETQMSEFAHDKGSFGYMNIVSYLQNHPSDFTEQDIDLIRQVIKRDCEIYQW